MLDTIMPHNIAVNAQRNLILKSEAATVPVQAPVMGKGMATNRASPKASYFWTISALFLVRSKSQLKNFSKIQNASLD